MFDDNTPPLTVFEAGLIGTGTATWQELFAGYRELKAITFSAGLDFLVALTEPFEDAEIIFGSEKILTKEHLALAQASQAVLAYGLVDALADHKVLTEGLGRLLDRSGRRLLKRVAGGTLRFRLLRGRPSHEKLCLLTDGERYRVITGSANLSRAAFTGGQHEIVIRFDGSEAWRHFRDYYERDQKDSIPIVADALVRRRDDGTLGVRETPLSLDEIPIVRAIEAGLVITEPPAPTTGGFTAEALRAAATLGSELKTLALPAGKKGDASVISATNLRPALRAWQARPVSGDPLLPRAEIDFTAGTVWLDGRRWLDVAETVPADAVRGDAVLLRDYLDSFSAFFGNADEAIDAYWAFLVWLYAAPAAPYLRQAAVPAGIDPWLYPVYAVLFGRSSGGKTAFARIATRSMFGHDRQLASREFTANKAIGLRDRLGAIPLLLDDITRERFTSHVPDLVRTDQVMSALYAPVILTTNRDVTTIPPDLTKRMVTCHIDAAIPENRSLTGSIKRRVEHGLGTALYRAYLQRLIPLATTMRAAMRSDAEAFPDLLKTSAEILRTVLGEALGDLPEWARARI
jgi:hypothetical protein